MLMLLATVPNVTETDECCDCDVGKVLASRIGAIDKRLRQILGSNILEMVKEEDLHSLYSFSCETIDIRKIE